MVGSVGSTALLPPFNDEPPFGTNGLVVVLSGGAAFFLKGDQLRNSFFNPAGTSLDPGLEIVGP